MTPDTRTLRFSPVAYFVDPFQIQGQGSAYALLRSKEHTIIIGEAGTGKTTMRLAVEANIRSRPDRTLVMSYLPGREQVQSMTLDDHLDRIRRAMSVDLFVQIVEQYNFAARKPSYEQNEALAKLIDGELQLKRVVGSLVYETDTVPNWGMADLWRRVARPVVRPVNVQPEMRDWAQAILALSNELSLNRDERSGESSLSRWREALGTVQLWGFKHVFLMVDSIDAKTEDPAEMMALIEPLLNRLGTFQREGVFLKLFIPLELNEAVRRVASSMPPQYKPVIRQLQWNEKGLRELMKARFRAVGSYREGFGDLVVPELSGKIDNILIREAKGSPRKLLRLINALIEEHVSSGGVEVLPILGSNGNALNANSARSPVKRNDITLPTAKVVLGPVALRPA
jgi:hypothetical protein